ncbi:MAG: homocysteine S-methyltransferase family protein, partial [Candidatus Heimdallarchaeaceae archaeon]
SEYPAILIEGSVIERISRGEFSNYLDKHIQHSGMIYDPTGKKVLEEIYNQYYSVAAKYDMPILTYTPTWRANPQRLKLAGFRDLKINSDCFQFLSEIREKYGEFSKKIFIGGLIGCKGDAYKAEEALSSEEAYEFHTAQVSVLADVGVDFLIASGVPALSEALGIARLMEKSKLSYVLSFIIRPNGKLLDGTYINQAISSIDKSVSKRPLFYMVVCVHPIIFKQAINIEENRTEVVRSRLKGLEGNGSSKSPEELVLLDELESEDPVSWAKQMVDLHFENDLQILGGCCGTDERHIDQIAKTVMKKE